jgi:hypothetical protein
MRASDVEALRTRDGVLRIDRVRGAWKIAPEIGRVAGVSGTDPGPRAGGTHLRLVIDVFDDVPRSEVIERLSEAGAQLVAVSETAGVYRCRARARAEAIPTLAALPLVSWIEEFGELELRNDAARWVIQSNMANETPLHDRGLLGAGEIVGHIDGEIFAGSCYFRDPLDDTPGPTHRKLVAYRSSTGPGANNHGTHTAGTVAGDPDPIAGILTNRGMAPKARISHANFFDIDGFNDTPSNLLAMLSAAHADGARVHSNSWGETLAGGYTTWSVDVDTFARSNEDDLVVFAIANAGNVVAPENSKNCLAVGKTNRAPSQDQQTGSNATGPTFDGRRKPDVCAPGVSTLAQQAHDYAWCDGPPYAYQSALAEAGRLLALAKS